MAAETGSWYNKNWRQRKRIAEKEKGARRGTKIGWKGEGEEGREMRVVTRLQSTANGVLPAATSSREFRKIFRFFVFAFPLFLPPYYVFFSPTPFLSAGQFQFHEEASFPGCHL